MIEKELLENPSPWMNDYAVAYYESIMRPGNAYLRMGCWVFHDMVRKV